MDRQDYTAFIHYANLGKTCDTSARVLIDNTKFFPLNNQDYKRFFTRMYQYPGYTPSWEEEDEKEKQPQKSSLKPSSKSCC